MIDLKSLSQFSKCSMSARQSIGAFVISILEETSYAEDKSSMIKELDVYLEIDLMDSMYHFAITPEEYMDSLTKIDRQQKKELLLAIVDIARKSGAASKKAAMTSGFFEKIGLSMQEQASIILENDHAKNPNNIADNQLKQNIKNMLLEQVERQTITALDRDPLKGSPLEGMRFMIYLSTAIESYKKGFADKKSEFEAESLDINEIFNEIRDQLTSKYLDFPR